MENLLIVGQVVFPFVAISIAISVISAVTVIYLSKDEQHENR